MAGDDGWLLGEHDLEAARLQHRSVELAAIRWARRGHDHAAAERVLAVGVEGHAWLERSLSRRGERRQGAVVVEVALVLIPQAARVR